MSSANPFKGGPIPPERPMRVLHRLTKPGHWAEIRERKLTHFDALEFFVFVDGSLQESQMFHGGRKLEYPDAVASQIAQMVDGGWIEEQIDVPPLS